LLLHGLLLLLLHGLLLLLRLLLLLLLVVGGNGGRELRGMGEAQLVVVRMRDRMRVRDLVCVGDLVCVRDRVTFDRDGHGHGNGQRYGHRNGHGNGHRQHGDGGGTLALGRRRQHLWGTCWRLRQRRPAFYRNRRNGDGFFEHRLLVVVARMAAAADLIDRANRIDRIANNCWCRRRCWQQVLQLQLRFGGCCSGCGGGGGYEQLMMAAQQVLVVGYFDESVELRKSRAERKLIFSINTVYNYVLHIYISLNISFPK